MFLLFDFGNVSDGVWKRESVAIAAGFDERDKGLVNAGERQDILGLAVAADGYILAGRPINGSNDIKFVAVGTLEHLNGLNYWYFMG
jgi:hypothetical protein